MKYGTVTLKGVVDNLAARRAAEQDARNVIGVRRVKNYLKVRPDVIPTNEELETRVALALSNDPFVERWDVDINAFSGSVYLSGRREHRPLRKGASRARDGCAGQGSDKRRKLD